MCIRDRPHGGYYNTMNLIYKSGLIVDLESVVNSYYLSNDIEYTFSPDGSKLFFINQVDGVNEYKQIDLTTLMISPSNSDEYLSARYLAGISDFTADVNGVKIPVYSIGGNDAVKFTDLEFCGYDMGPVSYTHLDVYKRQLPNDGSLFPFSKSMY